MLVNEPLLYIDGARADNAAQSSTSGTAISRFDDMSVEEIDRIEILPGAAAAALYGSGAANGVIAITTRQPEAGPLRWRARGSVARATDPGGYPANFSRPVLSYSTPFPLTNCTLAQEAAHQCVPGAVRSYNPLAARSPFRDASLASLAASVTGGSRRLAFALSADGARDQGTLPNDADDRADVRGSLHARPIESLDVAVSAGYVSRTIHPTGYSLSSELTGPLTSTGPRGDFSGFDANDFPISASQTVKRLIGSGSIAYRARDWLEASAGAGLDRDDRRELSTRALGKLPGTDYDNVHLIRGDHRFSTTTLHADLTGSRRFMRVLSTRTTVGASRFIDKADGSAMDSSGAGPLYDISERQVFAKRTRSSLRFIEELAVGPRLSATIATHSERDDRLERETKWYPSASVAYAVRKESEPGALGAMRLRAAYGSAGRGFVLFRDADLTTSAPSLPLSVLTFPLTAFSFPPNLPSPDFTEETRELEGGIDVSFWNKRVSLSITAYDRATKHALTNGPGSPFDVSPFLPGMSVDNRGVEGSLDTWLFERGRLRGWLTISAWTNRSRIDDIRFSPTIGTYFVLKPGYPIDGYNGRLITSVRDLNGNGVIDGPACSSGSNCEVTLSDSAYSLGSSTPSREVALLPRIAVGRRLIISAQLDYRGGYRLYNQIESFRCQVGICSAAVTPGSPLTDQARTAASLAASDVGFFEDASFVRLRALSVAYNVPRADVRITLAARNLATWTRYSGTDPEVNSRGALNGAAVDLGAQPAPRTVLLRLDLVR